MRYSRFLPYGAVAISAWMVGSVCGYGFSPSQRIHVYTAPAPVANPAAITASNAEITRPAIGVLAPESARKPVAIVGTAEHTVTLPLVTDCAVNSSEAFRLNVSTGWPVVVVRTVEEESVWYVQDYCEQADGGVFTCSAIFGNASTPAGTKFELAGIVAGTADEARQFTPGTILHELPGKMPMTPVVTVVRR